MACFVLVYGRAAFAGWPSGAGGRATKNVLPTPADGFQPDFTTEPPHHAIDQGQADAFALRHVGVKPLEGEEDAAAGTPPGMPRPLSLTKYVCRPGGAVRRSDGSAPTSTRPGRAGSR